MSDSAHKQTDALLGSLEKKLKSTYSEAAREAQKKFSAHMAAFKVKDERHRKDVREGRWTQKDYEDWRKNQLLIADRFAEVRDTIAEDLHHVDKIAMQMVRDGQVDVYALNHNYGTYDVEHKSKADTSYSLYDHSTVERLMRDDPELLPPPSPQRQAEIDAKDIRWNRQKLTSAFTASVLAGDSIPKIAERISRVADMDAAAAIRNARTMYTGAENAGRQDAYIRAQNMGIKLRKTWIANHDGHTRESHMLADGQTVGTREMFSLMYGELEYPGDPSGPPAEVYNCRCTMVTEFDGFDFSQGSGDLVSAPEYGEMDFEEWTESHTEKLFNKQNDPLFDKMGSIKDTNPQEMNRIVESARNKGVEIINGTNSMSYAPGLRKGQPGQLHIDGTDSLGAWKHEERHMLDDEEDGWAGMAGLMDVERRSEMEYNAYKVEIEIAKKHGFTDTVKQLKAACKKEIKEIGGKWDERKLE